MPGENILVVDDSVAVQELCRATLEPQGYRVTVASNGVAAISFPDLPDVDLLIIDKDLRGVSGLQTTRSVKTDPELYRKPILLLVPEEEAAAERESQNLYGGNAWLKKPFDPQLLVNKVQIMLEEREVLSKGREFLRQAAEDLMRQLAEKQIQQAVDQKTQIIVERALQAVVTQVDQRARREVDAKVTQLSAEKEQELVKMTVHEVARSMVEKLAEKKVTEAMEQILAQETEKAIRRAAESMLPGLVRDRIRENLETLLPKEIEGRVKKEAENMIPQVSQQVVGIIEVAAQKVVPKAAREILGEVTERHVEVVIEKQLPKHVQMMVATELDHQARMKIEPIVSSAGDRVARRLRVLIMVLCILVVVAVGLLLADRRFDFISKIPGFSPPPGTHSSGEVTAQPTPASGIGSLFERLSQPPKPTPAPSQRAR